MAAVALAAAAAVSVASGPPAGHGSGANADTGAGARTTGPTTPSPAAPTHPNGGTGNGNGNGDGGQANPATPDAAGGNPNAGASNSGQSSGDQHGSDHAAPVPADVTPGTGKVKVTLPGSDTPIDLDAAESLPAGTIIDASDGSVSLKDPVGHSGTFSGGSFVIGRTGGAHPRTDIKLTGGDFSSCPAPGLAKRSIHAAGRSPRAIVRSLWGRDHGGRFRTRGSHATATVRGTVWLTQDRCDGTRVAVRKGVVVVRDQVRHRSVVVRAGHSYLARNPH